MDNNAPATKRRKLSEADLRLTHKNNISIDADFRPDDDEEKQKEISFRDSGDSKRFGEKVPVILDLKHRFALPQIINHLDPTSFVRFAQTCRTMHDCCFHSKGIKIIYNIARLDIQRAPNNQFRMKFSKWIEGPSYEDIEQRFLLQSAPNNQFKMEFSKRIEGPSYENIEQLFSFNEKPLIFFESEENRKLILEKYPFVFQLLCLNCLDVEDDNWVPQIHSFLKQFRIQSITEVSVDSPTDWNSFIRLLLDFRVRSLELFNSDVPEEMTSHFLQLGLTSLASSGSVPDRLVLESDIPHLDLFSQNLSDAFFRALISKCAASTDWIYWCFGLTTNQPTQFPPHEHFKTLDFENQEPLPEERPLIFVKEGSNNEFWILRKDGKVVRCFRELLAETCTFSVVEEFLPPCLSSTIPIASSLTD